MTAFAEEGGTDQGEVGYWRSPRLHSQFSPRPPGSMPEPASVAPVWGSQDAAVKVPLSCYSWGVVRKEGIAKAAPARLLVCWQASATGEWREGRGWGVCSAPFFLCF